MEQIIRYFVVAVEERATIDSWRPPGPIKEYFDQIFQKRERLLEYFGRIFQRLVLIIRYLVAAVEERDAFWRTTGPAEQVTMGPLQSWA